MSFEQRIVTEELFDHPLQFAVDRYHGGWAVDHSLDSQKSGGKIEVIAAGTRPEQDVSHALVPVNPESLEMDDTEFFKILEQSLGWAFKSPEKARAFINDISNSPTTKTNKTPLVESINKLQTEGKNTGLVFAHSFLMDIGYGLAGLSIARGKTDYLANNVTLLNKTMAYEKFEDVPMVDLGSPFSNIVFVSPRTKTARNLQARLGISDDVPDALNRKAGRVLKPFTDKGAIIALAFHGAGMLRSLDAGGRLTAMQYPEMDPSSVRLTEKLDYQLQITMWKDPSTGDISWHIGSLEKVPKPSTQKLPQEERQLFNQMVVDLMQCKQARTLQKLSGIPVTYEPLVQRTDPRRRGSMALRALFSLEAAEDSSEDTEVGDVVTVVIE